MAHKNASPRTCHAFQAATDKLELSEGGTFGRRRRLRFPISPPFISALVLRGTVPRLSRRPFHSLDTLVFPQSDPVEFQESLPCVLWGQTPFSIRLLPREIHSSQHCAFMMVFPVQVLLLISTLVGHIVCQSSQVPTVSAVGAKLFFSNGTQYYIKGKPESHA